MELVWGDVCHVNSVIEKVLNKISSIASHFHKSAVRANELKKIAAERSLSVLSLPKLFTIRWTEFSFTLINNLLRSWHLLMIYFDANKESNAIEMGFFKFLSKIENLKVLTFLADLLQVFSRHHKKTQDDKLTIVSLVQSNRSLHNALIDLKERHFLGGCEETLHNYIQDMNDDGNFILRGFELLHVDDTQRGNNTGFESIRNGIIDSIVTCPSKRFEVEDKFMEIIEPFINFEKETDLRKIHELFASDLDLTSIQLQFNFNLVS